MEHHVKQSVQGRKRETVCAAMQRPKALQHSSSSAGHSCQAVPLNDRVQLQSNSDNGCEKAAIPSKQQGQSLQAAALDQEKQQDSLEQHNSQNANAISREHNAKPGTMASQQRHTAVRQTKKRSQVTLSAET